jgi:hypothetical protein
MFEIAFLESVEDIDLSEAISMMVDLLKNID